MRWKSVSKETIYRYKECSSEYLLAELRQAGLRNNSFNAPLSKSISIVPKTLTPKSHICRGDRCLRKPRSLCDQTTFGSSLGEAGTPKSRSIIGTTGTNGFEPQVNKSRVMTPADGQCGRKRDSLVRHRRTTRQMEGECDSGRKGESGRPDSLLQPLHMLIVLLAFEKAASSPLHID
jgi:hypothetical protein